METGAVDSAFRAILAPRHRGVPTRPVPGRLLVGCVAAGGALYGAAMGSYSVIEGGHLIQILFSALKVPLLLGISAGITLPPVFVLYTLQGLQEDFRAAVRALLEGQAALAAVLASLAPLTPVLYWSGLSYRVALCLNVGVFVCSALAAQGIVRNRLRSLVERDRRHATLLRLWFALFAFVAVQLSWNLRPFVGNPKAPAEFFRPDAFTNAYMALLKIFGF